MRGRLAPVVAIACLALTACVAIPTHSEVKEGETEVAQPNPILPILQGPEPGASAEAIVRGFLTAASGGSVSGFEVAREFLLPEAAAQWDPLAAVTVYDSRQVVPAFDDEAGVFVYEVPVAAHVDGAGVLTEAAAEASEQITFHVALDADGEYRIAELEDGIVLSAADFTRFFRPVALAFATADGTTVVPDLRWFANNDQISTAVADQLVYGPSTWLADAVTTGFPPGAALDVNAVVVDDGTAHVALAPGSAGDPAARSLAVSQLDLTLTQLRTVQEVEATVGNVPLGGDGSSVLAPAGLPAEAAAVVAAGRLGLFDGTSVSVTPDAVGLVPAGASGLAVSYDLAWAALVLGGDVVVTDALVATELDPLDAVDPEAPPLEAELATTVLIDGDDLVAPSFDDAGWLWSAERATAGEVLVARPGGEAQALAAPWLAGRRIQALAVSRDGARLAILSRINEEQVLEVAAIVRDAEGAPLGLSAPLAIGASLRPSIDVAWADDVSLVTLGEESGEIALTQVGGWSVDIASLPGATALTARNGELTLHGVDGEGALVARSGSGWKTKTSGVSDVAYAG